jgi:hypothetical protein
VPEKHLEAWRLSQENTKNGSKGALNKTEGEAIIRKMETLIQSVPLDAYHEIVGSSKHPKKSNKKEELKTREHEEADEDMILSEEELMQENVTEAWKMIALSEIIKERKGSSSMEHRDAMKSLLLEYRKQFLEAIEFMKAKNESVPPNIEEAVKHINSVLGYKHWAGSF